MGLCMAKDRLIDDLQRIWQDPSEQLLQPWELWINADEQQAGCFQAHLQELDRLAHDLVNIQLAWLELLRQRSAVLPGAEVARLWLAMTEGAVEVQAQFWSRSLARMARLSCPGAGPRTIAVADGGRRPVAQVVAFPRPPR
jgi:hypothetical protein